MQNKMPSKTNQPHGTNAHLCAPKKITKKKSNWSCSKNSVSCPYCFCHYFPRCKDFIDVRCSYCVDLSTMRHHVLHKYKHAVSKREIIAVYDRGLGELVGQHAICKECLDSNTFPCAHSNNIAFKPPKSIDVSHLPEENALDYISTDSESDESSDSSGFDTSDSSSSEEESESD